MSEQLNSGRLFGRRRRANAAPEEKRTKRYEVGVTAAEDAVLRSRASALEVTVPRLLFEAAMNPQSRPDTEWKAVAADLFEIRRLMGTVANNVNQLARFANEESRFPAEAEVAIQEYQVMVGRLDQAVRTLAGL